MTENGNDWPEQRMREWEKLRAKGPLHFIWIHGVLQWGGFMFCFSLAFFQFQHYGNLFSTEGNLAFRVLVGLAIWTFVGMLYGRSRWQRNEQIFLDQKRSQGRTLEP